MKIYVTDLISISEILLYIFIYFYFTVFEKKILQKNF